LAPAKVGSKQLPARIAVYGDSNCVDDAHAHGNSQCFELFDALMDYLVRDDERAKDLLNVSLRLSAYMPAVS
jgi:hypothetical protein